MAGLLWLGNPTEVRAAQDFDDVIAAAVDSGTFAGVVLVHYGNGGSPGEVRTAYSLMYTGPGAGGAVGTADDLVRFARAVFSDGLLPQEALQKMLTPDPVVHERYADGWVVRQREGYLSYSHTGGTNGFLSSLEYYPELDLTIVILSNLGFTDLRGLSGSIAEIALETATGLEAR